MPEVEVAVGYVGGQWEAVWVEVGKDNGIFRSDEVIAEIAEEVVLKQAARARREVSFTKVIHVPEPEDDIDA